MVDFKATTQGGKGTLAIFYSDGESKTLQSTHPTYSEVLTYLVATPVAEHDEDLVREMANPAVRIGKRLKAVDPRFDFDMFTLSFDGLPLSGDLADLIKDRLANGKSDWERFARFLARLESNPSYGAKQALYTFIKGNGLHILADGRFVGHKTVLRNGLLSAHSGPNNFVNGVLYGKPGESVQVPHHVGTVVSKRRGDVDDSSMACSTGLHVGSREYASTFSQVMLTVAVAPEDVVGGNYHEKFRTASYEVLGVNPDMTAFVGPDFEVVDFSSEPLSNFEREIVDASTGVKSRDHGFTDEQRAGYNSLPSVGRSLYDRIRTLLNKTHEVALETALAEYGTYEEWIARRDAEREQARQDAEVAEQAAREALAEAVMSDLDAAAAAPMSEQALVEAAEQALALNEDDYGTPEHLASLATMDQKAEVSAALKADLLSNNIGHKPLARKWESAGVTEASVRRWRKANDVQVTLRARVGL